MFFDAQLAIGIWKLKNQFVETGEEIEFELEYNEDRNKYMAVNVSGPGTRFWIFFFFFTSNFQNGIFIISERWFCWFQFIFSFKWCWKNKTGGKPPTGPVDRNAFNEHGLPNVGNHWQFGKVDSLDFSGNEQCKGMQFKQWEFDFTSKPVTFDAVRAVCFLFVCFWVKYNQLAVVKIEVPSHLKQDMLDICWKKTESYGGMWMGAAFESQ